MIRIYLFLVFCILAKEMRFKVSPHKQDFQYTTVYGESDDDLIAKKLDIAKRGKFCYVGFKGVFRTLSNINNGIFCK